MVSDNFRKFPVSKNALSDAQTTAAAMLATGKSYQRVADELKVDVRTIYNWRKLPAFRRAARARREAIWNEAADRLRAMLTRAMDIFETQLEDRFQPTQFRAANAVLRHTGVRAAIDPTKRQPKQAATRAQHKRRATR